MSSDSTQVTYQSTRPYGKTHTKMDQQGIRTLEQMLKYVTSLYKNKRCLGTREILAEEDERQPDGKMFKKLKMGKYQWRTFAEAEAEAQNFGKGMRELGMDPRDRVVVFAETRAEWMIAAHGLFKQSVTVCTIYATLGEDGVAFGVNETDVKYVVTSHELLPKIRNILKDIPNVHTVVFFEDQLHQTDTSGFGDVRIVPYKEVVKKGSLNRFGKNLIN